MSSAGMNEDALALQWFPMAPHADPKAGRFEACYASWVSDESARMASSSGGMATWLAVQMLRQGLIDGVAHVHPRIPTDNDDRLFAYHLSRSESDIRAGAKSRYYAVEMSGVLRQIREQPGRYAVIGVPCFIKAVRLLQQSEPIFRERIAHTISILCGQMKSTWYGQALAWQTGVAPGNIRALDFRYKMSGKPASSYHLAVQPRDGSDPHIVPVGELFGGDWGMGCLKYEACDYCDDILGETADVALGDAWLPKYVHDSRGTNVLIVRQPALHDLLRRGANDHAIVLEPLAAEAAVQSQIAAFRHRRTGLAYRLHLKQRQGIAYPVKRVTPSAGLSLKMRLNFRIRMLITRSSFYWYERALRAGDIRVYLRGMKKWALIYSIWKRLRARR